MKEKIEGKERKRAEWLGLAKELTMKCLARNSRFRDLCPDSFIKEADRQESLRSIAVLTGEIDNLAKQINDIEHEADIGAQALLGDKSNDISRKVAALLVTARLNGDASGQIQSLQDIVDLISARDLSLGLEVRCMFRDDGVFSSHISISMMHTLDESYIRLREPSFNICMGLAQDKSELLCDAAARTGRWR